MPRASSLLITYTPQVPESKAPTELIDLENAEQEELYALGQDAYEKSYDRLIKSKKYPRIPLSTPTNHLTLF